MHFRISLVAVLLQIIAAKTVDFLAAQGANDESERIIAGQDAAVGQFPWMTVLMYNGRFICSSSIITPRTILTAAHCVVFDGVLQPPEAYTATANTFMSADGQAIQIADIMPHPEYDPNRIENDIALLTTTQDIVFDDEVKPICIAGKSTSTRAYRNATAMGWGNTSRDRNNPVIPDNLQYVSQAIIPNTVCMIPYFGMQVERTKICAKGLNLRGFNGICNGDSGGPLVHLSRNRPPVEIGIASYINAIFGCGSLAPGVWTRVASYNDFIKGNVIDPENLCEVTP